jgi:hypothetical protein
VLYIYKKLNKFQSLWLCSYYNCSVHFAIIANSLLISHSTLSEFNQNLINSHVHISSCTWNSKSYIKYVQYWTDFVIAFWMPKVLHLSTRIIISDHWHQIENQFNRYWFSASWPVITAASCSKAIDIWNNWSHKRLARNLAHAAANIRMQWRTNFKNSIWQNTSEQYRN